MTSHGRYLSDLLLQCFNLIIEFIDIIEQSKVLVLNYTLKCLGEGRRGKGRRGEGGEKGRGGEGRWGKGRGGREGRVHHYNWSAGLWPDPALVCPTFNELGDQLVNVCDPSRLLDALETSLI